MPSSIHDLFHEEQRFTQKWLWIIIGGSALPVSLFLIYMVYARTVLNEPVGDPNQSDALLFLLVTVFFLLDFLIILAFRHVRLETVVTRENLSVQFTWLGKEKVPIADIASATVREYHPIREYGGWGLRMGPSGKAYNVRGNMGVQITRKNGKTFLIGSQRAEELGAVLGRLLEE
ncbi:MAG TPA: hypothetical protein PKV71_07995 [Calditrichia bacterium]|nr:hypothetical protein [Calditrichota bacterium]HQV31803.1 hypothetical protein [Calditrichia bacterium]